MKLIKSACERAIDGFSEEMRNELLRPVEVSISALARIRAIKLSPELDVWLAEQIRHGHDLLREALRGQPACKGMMDDMLKLERILQDLAKN